MWASCLGARRPPRLELPPVLILTIVTAHLASHLAVMPPHYLAAMSPAPPLPVSPGRRLLQVSCHLANAPRPPHLPVLVLAPSARCKKPQLQTTLATAARRMEGETDDGDGDTRGTRDVEA